MKNLLRFFLAAVLIATLQLAMAAPVLALKNGMPVPGFTLPDVAGHPVSPLTLYRGKVVLLNFWATTCGACLAEIPALNTLYRQLKAKGVVVIGVAVDSSLGAVASQVAKSNIGYPVVVDQEKSIYFDLYGLFGLPVTLLIDKKGNLAGKFMGELKPDSPQLRDKISSLL